MVLNKNDDVELINNAAQSLLGFKTNEDLSLTLNSLPGIKEPLEHWRGNQARHGGSTIVPAQNGRSSELRISLANLELGKDEDTLVFIEDNRAIAQQAQQLKLASLGRLTASIAHEIRNPLSAISHAGQLLNESLGIEDDDRRLLEIINNHTRRVNQIIENILHVSRRRPASPGTIELVSWTEEFLQDYAPQTCAIGFDAVYESVSAQFDNSQLHQIVTNLLANATRHAVVDSDEQTPVKIEIGIEPSRETPYLKVIDNGPGIPSENKRHIFEPFFTTEKGGSGLGLFICKELCEANQALIDYTHGANQPSCFTIRFAHPDKVQK